MKNPFSAASTFFSAGAARVREAKRREAEAAEAEPSREPEASSADHFVGFGKTRPKRVVERADPEADARRSEEDLGEEDWSEVDEIQEPVAARSFSGRTVLLLLVVLALVLPLAPTVHRYFSQQAEISSLQQNIDKLKAEQSDLKKQESRWNDDDYVRQQARERLFYVNPGETPYVVSGKDQSSQQPKDDSAEASSSMPPSWGANLWSSLTEASQ
ncbi:MULTISPECIES: FtsB family cell division protein [Micrococcales]|uniref:FtsB family cell division protein n=1 Tax=Micrococcales TaxID=85006 RepID=UPI00068E240D|nr:MULTISPECIES: septum formation initiator family protein [Micrococcales]